MNVYERLRVFYKHYRGEKRTIGCSAEGRDIYAFFIGEHKKPLILSQYAIHAREYITAFLAAAHIGRGLERGGAWIIPLTNPDGALLVCEGIGSVRVERRQFLFNLNRGNGDFSLWKANAEGVDLNVNFNARWGTGRHNLRVPAPENFIGTAPFCAPESRALRDFTEEVKPDLTVSWHTKGEEIYWRFHQPPQRAKRDAALAKALSESTGYPLKDTYSAGGYKDWCVEKLRIPAFTVEVGSDELTHPIGMGAFGGIAAKNRRALYDLSAAFFD